MRTLPFTEQPDGYLVDLTAQVKAGVEHIDEGQISFRGQRIDGLKPHRIFHLGMGRTFQIIRVFPELTALENLDLYGRLYRLPERRERR